MQLFFFFFFFNNNNKKNKKKTGEFTGTSPAGHWVNPVDYLVALSSLIGFQRGPISAEPRPMVGSVQRIKCPITLNGYVIILYTDGDLTLGPSDNTSAPAFGWILQDAHIADDWPTAILNVDRFEPSWIADCLHRYHRIKLPFRLAVFTPSWLLCLSFV